MMHESAKSPMRQAGGRWPRRLTCALQVACVLWMCGATASGQGSAGIRSTVAVKPVILRADPHYNPSRVPPPPGVGEVRVDSVSFTVNFNPGGGADLVPWPSAARQAVHYAVSIWETLLNGTQTIEFDAYWSTNVSGDLLGYGAAETSYRDFSGAPASGTWYAVAMANQLSGSDLNGGEAEMYAAFNANHSWYFGTDGEPGPTEYDFVSVVVHEICHGLGFTAWMNWDDGTGGDECSGSAGEGCWGDGSGYPSWYDRFIVTGTGLQILTLANPSIALGNRLISGDLYFDGNNARAAYGGNAPPLYAPAVWEPWSSISHLDEATFNGTSHALMTPALSLGESAHHPGTITLGILEDGGWPLPLTYATVYVDGSVPGPGQGTPGDPFPTVADGVKFVADDGTVKIKAGNYDETLTIRRPMTLQRHVESGSVIIGE